MSEKYKQLAPPSKEEVGRLATVWDAKKHLLVQLPLPDRLLPLYLDKQLPAVLELVEEGRDRRVRVAAAEELHVLLTDMIGQTSQQTEDIEKKAPMTELFRRVLPVFLNLCSDTDSVIQVCQCINMNGIDIYLFILVVNIRF